MAEITAAIDEGGANKLLDGAVAAVSLPPKSGSGSLGPFVAGYTASATLVNGNVDLIPPDTIRIADLQLDWHVDLSFGIDLGAILPEFCLPQVCVDLPCIGRVCTPRICIDWPTITVPVSFSDFLKATVDFTLDIVLSGGQWIVRIKVLGVPNLQFGPTSALLLAAIAAAVTPILLLIPFIGPILAGAVAIILATIGIAGVTGLLGPMLTPFISGLEVDIYKQPQLFQVLPIEGPVDPAVDVTIDTLDAAVAHNGTEDELVLTADISPA